MSMDLKLSKIERKFALAELKVEIWIFENGQKSQNTKNLTCTDLA